jgi:hypothetical protein
MINVPIQIAKGLICTTRNMRDEQHTFVILEGWKFIFFKKLYIYASLVTIIEDASGSKGFYSTNLHEWIMYWSGFKVESCEKVCIETRIVREHVTRFNEWIVQCDPFVVQICESKENLNHVQCHMRDVVHFKSLPGTQTRIGGLRKKISWEGGLSMTNMRIGRKQCMPHLYRKSQ